MLKDNPSKVEIGASIFNAILVLDKPRPLASRDPQAHAEMFYAHEWIIVGDALDNPEGGSFSTQTGTVYRTVDAAFGWPVDVKASDVVQVCALPDQLQSGDGVNMFNLSFQENQE
jgi:hypothetical protein